ncbi:MAG TPA: hypothetical protein VE754_02170 [Actinomycetota bacterium]|jgi:plastocyanin|nr:hypothetical protein [Actinomycetota bacterium]
MRRVLLALTVLVTAGCEALPPPPEAGPSPTVGDVAEDVTPTPTDCHDLSAAEAGEEVVVMLDNEFEPSCFAISSTQAVQLANNGSNLHNFSIADALDVDVEPGGHVNTDPLEDVVAPGTYDFSCKYHAGVGMIGVIIIE